MGVRPATDEMLITLPGSYEVPSFARTSVRLHDRIERLREFLTTVRASIRTPQSLEKRIYVRIRRQQWSKRTVEDALHVECKQTIPALFREAVIQTQ